MNFATRWTRSSKSPFTPHFLPSPRAGATSIGWRCQWSSIHRAQSQPSLSPPALSTSGSTSSPLSGAL